MGLITLQEKKVIVRNFASLTTLQGLSYLLPILVIPYLIRTITADKFGLIAFAQAFVQYFMLLTDYGFSITATRKIALCKANRQKTCSIFSSVLTVKILLAAISFLILAAVVHFVPKFNRDWPVYILSFGTVIGNSLFPVWFFQGKEKMAYIAGVNIAVGILYVLAIFIFVRAPGDYLLVPILTSGFFIVSGIAGIYIAFKKFGLEFIFQRYADVQKEFKAGWSIFISIAAINTYTTSRVFAVGLFATHAVTAYYSIAERIAGFIQTFPLDSLSKALYPRLNKIYANNKNRARTIITKAQKTATRAFLVAVPAAYWAAPKLVELVCGARYAEATITLRILLLGVLCAGSNALRIQYLLISARSDLYSKIHISAALIGLPLIFLLSYTFSYFGAACASALIEVGILLASGVIVGRIIKKH
jgi:PST family polysaccharide transporter